MSSAQEIVGLVLQLPEPERSALAIALLERLDGSDPGPSDEIWAKRKRLKRAAWTVGLFHESESGQATVDGPSDRTRVGALEFEFLT